MRVTPATIGEHNVFVLVNAVGRRPAEGRKGTVMHVFPGFKMVEIVGIENSDDDMLEYLPDIADEHLRLVWKCPPQKPRTAGD